VSGGVWSQVVEFCSGAANLDLDLPVLFGSTCDSSADGKSGPPREQKVEKAVWRRWNNAAVAPSNVHTAYCGRHPCSFSQVPLHMPASGSRSTIFLRPAYPVIYTVQHGRPL
jgi:hypothetical protein